MAFDLHTHRHTRKRGEECSQFILHAQQRRNRRIIYFAINWNENITEKTHMLESDDDKMSPSSWLTAIRTVSRQIWCDKAFQFRFEKHSFSIAHIWWCDGGGGGGYDVCPTDTGILNVQPQPHTSMTQWSLSFIRWMMAAARATLLDNSRTRFNNI